MNDTLSRDQEVEAISFTGQTSEYFGIWIVNVILTLITLGIYSAWAKVRTQTYFLNHTSVDGQPFNYHATGSQILIGRIIAGAVLIAINVLSAISPVISVILLPAIFFGLPVIINRAMQFKARMTSYRNVRFQWSGDYVQTLWLYIISPILLVFTLYLALPILSRASAKYFGSRLKFGTTSFSVSELKLADFYRAFLLAASVPVVLLILGFIIVRLTNSPAIFPLFVVVMIGAATAYGAMVRNILINHLSLSDAVRFKSTLDPLTVLGIAITNWLAILFTLGLAFPWAKIRMYRYLCEHTHYEKLASFDQFRDDMEKNSSTISEGLSDFEGLEIGV